MREGGREGGRGREGWREREREREGKRIKGREGERKGVHHSLTYMFVLCAVPTS